MASCGHKPRRVIARLEHGPQGADLRFIITDLRGSEKALYERRYCARGEAENRIKEAQSDLFGRRPVATASRPPRFGCCWPRRPTRLMSNPRLLALQGTELDQACTGTIRTRLLKNGAALCATRAAVAE